MAATVVVAAFCLILAPAPAFAWNGFGHMVVAAAAYKKLDAPARKKVATLLKLNPQYTNWVKNVATKSRDEVAFVMAATWPDEIKHESGYQNDGEQPQGPDSGRNIGYADKLQHRYWHFIDVPFSPDGTALKQPIPPNAKTQIAVFWSALKSSTTSDDVKSYDLVWLLHMVGDVHQPLHCTSRFDKEQPAGDRGGNLVALLCVAPCPNELHALWDDAIGTQTSPTAAIQKSTKLKGPSAGLAAISDESTWIDESFK